MQSIFVFLDIIKKVADFWYKNAYLSRIQRVFRVFRIFFGSSLDQIEMCQVSSLWDMYDIF